jgi:hypothetical protein
MRRVLVAFGSDSTSKFKCSASRIRRRSRKHLLEAYVLGGAFFQSHRRAPLSRRTGGRSRATPHFKFLSLAASVKHSTDLCGSRWRRVVRQGAQPKGTSAGGTLPRLGARLRFQGYLSRVSLEPPHTECTLQPVVTRASAVESLARSPDQCSVPAARVR